MNKGVIQKSEEILIDIVRGYSVLERNGHEFYFKHFSLMDSLELDEQYRKILKSAIKAGIKNEESIIQNSIKNKKWSINQEEEIKSLEWSIEKLKVAYEKINDSTQRYSAKKGLESKREELLSMKEKRRELCNLSAESFAETRKIKLLICNFLYSDSLLTKKIEEDIAISYAGEFFTKINELNDTKIIANTAYNTCFFELFSINYRQPHVLFKNQGFELTVFQKNLLTYANAILNKLKNVSIPDKISKDPLKILEYKEVEKTEESSIGLDDLKRKSAARGGKLVAEDFLSN